MREGKLSGSCRKSRLSTTRLKNHKIENSDRKNQQTMSHLPPLRLLCLHGFRTSGEIMRAQVKRSFLSEIAAAASKGEQPFAPAAGAGGAGARPVEFFFLDGPIETEDEETVPDVVRTWFGPQENGYREWWNRNVKTGEYEGWWPLCFQHLLAFLLAQKRKGEPITGLCGFSQGGFVSCYLLAVARCLELQGGAAGKVEAHAGGDEAKALQSVASEIRTLLGGEDAVVADVSHFGFDIGAHPRPSFLGCVSLGRPAQM